MSNEASHYIGEIREITPARWEVTLNGRSLGEQPTKDDGRTALTNEMRRLGYVPASEATA